MWVVILGILNFEARPGKIFVSYYLKGEKMGMVVCACHSCYSEKRVTKM
jgi:hypothetical protein